MIYVGHEGHADLQLDIIIELGGYTGGTRLVFCV